MDTKRAVGKGIEIGSALVASMPLQMLGGKSMSLPITLAVGVGKLISTGIIYAVRLAISTTPNQYSQADIDGFLLLFVDDILTGFISALVAVSFLGANNFWAGWLLGAASSQAGKVTRQLAGYPVVEIVQKKE